MKFDKGTIRFFIYSLSTEALKEAAKAPYDPYEDGRHYLFLDELPQEFEDEIHSLDGMIREELTCRGECAVNNK